MHWATTGRPYRVDSTLINPSRTDLPSFGTLTGWLAQRIDRYRRPYEGTHNRREAMQAYLDWEFGLVEQLGRDGTHGFHVI